MENMSTHFMPILKYRLLPNALPDVDGYHGVISHLGTIDYSTLCELAASGDGNLDAATVQLVMDTLFLKIAEILSERQYRVVLPHATFELAIGGSTDSIDGIPSGKVYVAIRPSAALKNAAAGIALVYDGETGDSPVFSMVETPGLDRSGKGVIVGTRPFRLSGSNLSASGADEGVRVIPAIGDAAVATVIAEDGAGAFITARLAEALPPGQALVELATRCFHTPEGYLQHPSRKVTILADDDPPTPTPTGDEPVVTSGHSSGYGDAGMIDTNADFILEGRNLAGASVKVDWTDEGGNARTQNIPAGEVTAEDEEITLQQGDWLEACTTADGAVLTFTVTTSHGSTTYQATVRA